jgi:mevalonate kinase
MNAERKASTCGKIILTGEYAVLFGKRGIAVPSKESVTIMWTADSSLPQPNIMWENAEPRWIEYVERILGLLELHTGKLKGTIVVNCSIPLGKGMGSSTALVIAMCRCLLGPACAKIALSIEDQINPGHSGIDFAVIWENAPILYAQGQELQIIDLPKDLLKNAKLIDTGKPNETTKELVAWMKTRREEIEPAINVIGNCTERLLKGEPLHAIMRDHQQAQVALGIVPEAVQKMIADIEAQGGAAKIIGAGARTGGGGMVLVLPALAQ